MSYITISYYSLMMEAKVSLNETIHKHINVLSDFVLFYIFFNEESMPYSFLFEFSDMGTLLTTNLSMSKIIIIYCLRLFDEY